MSGQPPTSNHRSLNGVVTKLVGDGATYGFINDEIFFPQTNVTGGPAAVGDQVFAECDYSAHLPIKWNASSVKILQRASAQQLQPPPAGNLVSDQSASVAVTYQQHRQQRQQRILDPSKPPEMNQQPFQPNDQPGRLLDPNTHSSDFFNQNDPRHQFAQQQQPPQQDGNIQPFQDIMGPPNLTYTSQPGSAFVQNQFVPPPFMTQPAPMLSHAQPPQHLLPNNPMQNQGNQRPNHQNKGLMSNRNNINMNNNSNNYNNNMGDKNDRHNRRNMNNRNDGKFDRPRSGDREGSYNNRTSRSRNSRDSSLGRGNKRDDIPSRPSPPSHSSARSSTSVSSDKTSKKKHYEIHNVPKIQIMTNMNAYNMKQRCPSSVHVPSDLKDIIVNRHFRLDIKHMPKPLRFTIEKAQSEVQVTSEQTDTESKPSIDVQPDTNQDVAQEKSAQMDVDQAEDAIKKEAEVESKTIEQPTPPSSKSTIKLSHKYGVKVILLSLPETEEIIHKVFGPNLDSFSSDSKSNSSLDEVIMLLCNKGSNNGHSLIGGKFDPILDGFLEGVRNEFEAQGGQPDLISTCRRVVLDQTGLDLSSCKSWTLLSTFIYNNRSDYFSPKASVEYSFIYIPHIWSMLSESFDKQLVKTESPDLERVQFKDESEPTEEPKVEADPELEIKNEPNLNEPSTESEQTITDPIARPILNLETLADLRVVDLKAELDKRKIEYKGLLKKAELIALLQESIGTEQNPSSSGPVESKESESSETIQPAIVSDQVAAQLEEGEVAPDEASPDDSPVNEAIGEKESVDESVGTKRKADDLDESVEAPGDNKKICAEESVGTAKAKRVELISESFVVRAKNEQQQSLSLLSLYDASQVGRSDQFELSVSSNILKESLIQHLSEYIMTALVEESRQRTLSSSSPAHTSTQSSSNASSQETGSDTNNNNGNKAAFKNPSLSDQEKVMKELPVDRYINIAFTFFDSAHTGNMYFDDLNKLFNNTGLTISRRALVSLVGDADKFNYRSLPDLSAKPETSCLYRFPNQFSRLPGTTLTDQQELSASTKMVEYQGVSYDLSKLIEQVNETETLRVKLSERFNYAIEKYDKQMEEIHVLEVSQKSLAKAIKAQNDEICDLKRERDTIKKKYESVRKGIKGAMTSLSDLVKEEK